MVLAATVIFIVGISFVLGSFIYAALNMGRAFSDSHFSFDSMFQSHVGAMIGMAVGGVITLISGVMFLFHFGSLLIEKLG
jgi:uncharacterized protein (DUF2062 family)